MCLGIPGRVVEILAGNAGQLALVDVLGARRPINLGMLEDPAVIIPGDWVLIHLGFALERIDRTAADQALAGLQLLNNGDDQAKPVPDAGRR